MPYFPQTTNPANHDQESDVRIRGELHFFQSIRDVLRFSYEIGNKQLRIFAEFGLSAEFTAMYNNLLMSLRICHELVENTLNGTRIRHELIEIRDDS